MSELIDKMLWPPNGIFPGPRPGPVPVLPVIPVEAVIAKQPAVNSVEDEWE